MAGENNRSLISVSYRLSTVSSKDLVRGRFPAREDVRRRAADIYAQLWPWPNWQHQHLPLLLSNPMVHPSWIRALLLRAREPHGAAQRISQCAGLKAVLGNDHPARK